MTRPWPWLVCALMLLGADPALAHKLKVFALVDGDHIAGYAYFVGGAKATGATITVTDADGNALARLVPDAEGTFRYTPRDRIDHVIVADSGDGHLARWTLRADTLPAGLGATPPTDPAPAPSAQLPPVPELAQPDPSAVVSEETIAAWVEQSVARQLRPLREQLEAHDARVRLQDVLGGIGYIVGLAGLALWWYGSRRRP
jgi:nickel transport protein